MTSVHVSHQANLFASDGDLAPGQVVPAVICDDPAARALFFFHAMHRYNAVNPSQLYAALNGLPDDRITDLIRRCFSARFPFYAAALFPADRESAHSPQAIIKSLNATYDWALEKCTARKAWTWAICCRGASDVGVGPGERTEQWLVAFGQKLQSGQTLSPPDPHRSDPFDLAVRWGLAAVPDWPNYADEGNTVTLYPAGRDLFMATWAENISPPDAAWRAAVWLATKERGLWSELLEHVVGHELLAAREAHRLVLPAPNGADHVVLLVGAAGAGKTSLLCALTEDGAGFEYQRAEGAGWVRTGGSEVPRQPWRNQERFNTNPGEHFERRGFETELTDGIRLVTYDVAGELLEQAEPTMATYEHFIRRSPPSAIVLLMGAAQESRQVCVNFVEVIGKAMDAVGADIGGHRSLFEVPVLILFTFADRIFDGWDPTLRDSLLGPQPLSCRVHEMRGGPEDVTALQNTLRESAFWAHRPHAALAFESKVGEFAEGLNVLLPKFKHLVLGFSCCSGDARKAGLRRSAGAHWSKLRATVAEAAGVATREELKARFADRVTENVAGLDWIRLMGARLSALRAPNINIDPIAAVRVARDWEAMKLETAFDGALREIEQSFEDLVASLPKNESWQLAETKPVDEMNVFEWLFASLGIPVNEALWTPEEALESEGDGFWLNWPERNRTQAGWSGDITVSSRWNQGASTVPSECDNGQGKRRFFEISREKKLSEGRQVALLFQRCLRDRGETEGEDQSFIKELVRALTHSRQDRGIFREQSLQRGETDVYAFSAAVSTAPRFARFQSVWRCQKFAAEALIACGCLAFPSAEKVKLSETPLVNLLKTAYLFRLLQHAMGRSLVAADVKIPLMAFLSVDVHVRLKKAIGRVAGPMLGAQKLANWTQDGPSDGQIYLLDHAVRCGKALISIADERLTGYLYAKLRYAQASRWFPDRQPQIAELLSCLEDEKTQAKEAWTLYRDKLPGVRREPYVRLFDSVP